jgi:hypothetical protein
VRSIRCHLRDATGTDVTRVPIGYVANNLGTFEGTDKSKVGLVVPNCISRTAVMLAEDGASVP